MVTNPNNIGLINLVKPPETVAVESQQEPQKFNRAQRRKWQQHINRQQAKVSKSIFNIKKYATKVT